MPTDVIMPQMGESIFEGTITKWLKKPGETVQRDEPLFEISTDKVDAEIPSPAAGVLSEIKIAEGTTVQINTVVGVIAESGAAAAPTPTAPQAVPKAEAEAEAPAAPAPSQPAAGHGTDGPGTDIVMPQMGESIFEGTITKWLKQVGDSVQRDEPLFEISTDKVDAEIPSPAAGVLSEIKVPAGTTVQINTVVGVIGGTAGASAAPAAPAPAPTKAEPPAAVPQEPAASVGENVRSSPLVRKIAKDNNLDLTQVSGTGAGGRITKTDVTSFLEKHSAGTGAPVAAPASAPAPQPAAVSAKPAIPAAPTTPALPGELVPLSRMRSIIAQRMVDSKHTNAHVHTVFKIDFTRIVKMREKEKSKYEQRNGVKLTYMPFISRAVIATLRKMPIVNASMEGDAIRYHKNINLGIAVALDWGLIVPVIKQAEERSFVGVARAIADLAERARGKKLKPDEVGSGTFTITNPGIFGEQFGTPIINQPESAILGVGGLFKEPAVITDDSGTDSIAIRHMIHLTLGFDHRIIDGADAGKFMAEVKKYLENWNEDIG
ncbi:MAG TPA: 2-oxo acid dehydrogenase subunit E2 [Alloacidobacterium sp.]|jgi:pyruvate dehydrogenase E2 component (dihydrolipoamide acetyltransferase)|nr:2-oxo acid dehydrogenase subunit E2 [Alloacidobacterium sp.]